jgi:hypothetical protein
LALGIVVVRRNSGIRPNNHNNNKSGPVHGIDNDDDDDDNAVILSSTTLWPLSERVQKSYNEWSPAVGHGPRPTTNRVVVCYFSGRWKFPNRFTPARLSSTSRALVGTQIVGMSLLPLLNTDENNAAVVFFILRQNPADRLAYVGTSPSRLQSSKSRRFPEMRWQVPSQKVPAPESVGPWRMVVVVVG